MRREINPISFMPYALRQKLLQAIPRNVSSALMDLL